MEPEYNESDLATREYWENQFETEIQNFEGHGDVGEVWFGDDVQEKAIQYIDKNFPDKNVSILDMGCGNASFLCVLFEKKGFTNLTGVDYSERSITLSKKIAHKMFGEKNKIVIKEGNAFDFRDKHEYDIIHDKGTFDVIYMMKEDNNQDYVKGVHYRFKPNDNSRLIITSCNCTTEELDNVFLKEGFFEKVEEIGGYKSFKFGGVQGQVVASCVYKPLVKEE